MRRNYNFDIYLSKNYFIIEIDNLLVTYILYELNIQPKNLFNYTEL